MENIELRDNIKKAIANEFEVEERDLTLDCDLKSTLELDILSLVDLVGLVEEEAGVKIENEDVKHIKTLKDLFEFVEAHVK